MGKEAIEKMKTVFISGVFDLFHAGHWHLLQQAKRYGELYVAVNCDRYASLKKGSDRPVDGEGERLNNVKKTNLVSCAFVYSDSSPLELIKGLKPDFIVAGDDYLPEEVVGYEECKEWGGQVIIVTRLGGISTTALIYERSCNVTH